MAFFPVSRTTNSGLLAVLPNGQVIRTGQYAPDPRGGQSRSAYYNYSPDRWGEHPDAYKLYMGQQGRLFRSYNPGLHGSSGYSNFERGYNPDGSIGKPFYAPGEPQEQGAQEFRWEWAPASDRAVWNKALAQLSAGTARNAGVQGSIHMQQTQGINGYKPVPVGTTSSYPGPYRGPTIPKLGAVQPPTAAPSASAPVSTVPSVTPSPTANIYGWGGFQNPPAMPSFISPLSYDPQRSVGASLPGGLV